MKRAELIDEVCNSDICLSILPLITSHSITCPEPYPANKKSPWNDKSMDVTDPVLATAADDDTL